MDVGVLVHVRDISDEIVSCDTYIQIGTVCMYFKVLYYVIQYLHP